MYIATATTILGRFDVVEILSDRLIADGTHFQLSILGDYHLIEDSDYVAPPDPTILVAAKVAKNTQINTWRLVANNTTFTHLKKVIACDELSRIDIDSTNAQILNGGAMPAGWLGAWKAVDNSYVPIANVTAWKAFYASMYTQGQVNFARSQTLKNALATAETVEQVNAIVW